MLRSARLREEVPAIKFHISYPEFRRRLYCGHSFTGKSQVWKHHDTLLEALVVPIAAHAKRLWVQKLASANGYFYRFPSDPVGAPAVPSIRQVGCMLGFGLQWGDKH